MDTNRTDFTPCEVQDADGHYHCPFAEFYMGYESEMCRNCCGLGVDEDSYPDEYDTEDYD